MLPLPEGAGQVVAVAEHVQVAAPIELGSVSTSRAPGAADGPDGLDATIV